ncbi:MAG: hypothetical protein H7X80_11595 [bacterium]|nr:hypothetical protein [Candidatus Kapabacteria bacterium]
MLIRIMITRALLLLAIVMPLGAQTVYQNNFELGDVAGWSTTVTNASFQRPIAITVAPFDGRQFLGDFGNQIVGYTASALPIHDSIRVELNLFVIRTWDGNAVDDNGPDVFTMRADGRDVLRTSFSNAPDAGQAYPGAYPGSDNRFMMGAVEKGSLGYMEGDAVYRLRIAFAHTAPTLTLSFEAALRDLYPTLANESWGIDSIMIEAMVRRPSSATLVAGTATAAPGEEVLIPIYARNAVELGSSGATSIRTRVRFNASMLLPISPTPQGVIIGNDRVIDMDLPLNIAGDSAIQRLNFRVAVGDDTVTAITLESSTAVGGSISLTERAGLFRVRGLCEDGGTRLFRSQQAALLRAPYPNPVRDHATVEYELAADEYVRIELLDAVGALRSTLVDRPVNAGKHSFEIATSILPSATYRIQMTTGYGVRQQTLVVVR